MGLRIGRNRNTTDEAITTIVSVGSAVAVVFAAANPNRIEAKIINPNPQDVVIHEYAANVDNSKLREKIGTDEIWRTTPDNVYTGEISGLMFSGGNRDVIVIEK